ncbi:type II toxin-antitoxin system HicB family antitoxin [Myxococcus guangdongensis]|uniref:type II toxin-antitoxin system HicB family antitoxin n=1 Tax=Myxococcus guangdongensis TaxID=2906760 RepID=UPI003898FD35
MLNEYQYVVEWEPADRVFVARVTEFPSLAAHGDSHEEALRELRGVVEEVVADLTESGEPVPEPLCLRQYSGKLNLRMPVDLHRRLAVEAERKGVSLNQFINMKLVQ